MASTVKNEYRVHPSDEDHSRKSSCNTAESSSPSKSMFFQDSSGKYMLLSEIQAQNFAKFPIGCRVLAQNNALFDSPAIVVSVAIKIESRDFVYKIWCEINGSKTTPIFYLEESALRYAETTLVWAMMPEISKNFVSAEVLHAAYSLDRSIRENSYTLITEHSRTICNGVDGDVVFHRSKGLPPPDSTRLKKKVSKKICKSLQEQREGEDVHFRQNSSDIQNITDSKNKENLLSNNDCVGKSAHIKQQIEEQQFFLNSGKVTGNILKEDAPHLTSRVAKETNELSSCRSSAKMSIESINGSLSPSLPRATKEFRRVVDIPTMPVKGLRKLRRLRYLQAIREKDYFNLSEATDIGQTTTCQKDQHPRGHSKTVTRGIFDEINEEDHQPQKNSKQCESRDRPNTPYNPSRKVGKLENSTLIAKCSNRKKRHVGKRNRSTKQVRARSFIELWLFIPEWVNYDDLKSE